MFAKALVKNFSMYLHRKLESRELMDLLVIHTNRFIQIMIHGETYVGEYKVCKRTIELIQDEIFSRQSYYLKPSFSSGKFDNSSVQH
jgi:hypothetical protein